MQCGESENQPYALMSASLVGRTFLGLQCIGDFERGVVPTRINSHGFVAFSASLAEAVDSRRQSDFKMPLR